MCGLFGYQFADGQMSEGRRMLLALKLAELNDTRGGHSWGTAVYDKDRPFVTRGLGDHGDHVRHMIGARSLFGHTRWGTQGARTVENAHPFEIGQIIGAHNGIFYNHAELNKKHARTFAVDSMHAFAHLDAGLPFDDIEGYGSIHWVDMRQSDTRRINLCMMRDGDLSVRGIGEHGGEIRGIVWSSDDKHLIAALKYAGIKKHFAYEVAEGVIHYVENGKFFIDQKAAPLKLSGGYVSRKWTWEDYRKLDNGKDSVMRGGNGQVIGWPDDDTLDVYDMMDSDGKGNVKLDDKDIPIEDVIDLDTEEFIEMYGVEAARARAKAMGEEFDHAWYEEHVGNEDLILMRRGR